ncbi:uncharacterized protein ACBR49_017762 [Aulostomus maculatus]
MKLDALRRFVDQRLMAATDDIFRFFAVTIAEYEDEMFRAQQEIERHRKLLDAAGRTGDTQMDNQGGTSAGVLASEDEQLGKGRNLSWHLKREEGGAFNADNTKFPDWLREKPEEDLATSANQMQFCIEGSGPGCKPDVLSVKQEAEEGHVVPEAAVRARISCQQDGSRRGTFLKAADVQVFTTEEEQQGESLSLNHLHVKLEEGGASGPAEPDVKFILSPDWQMDNESNEESSSSVQIQGPLPAPSEPGGTCRSSGDPIGNVIQSESSIDDNENTGGTEDQQVAAQSEPGLLGSLGSLESLGTLGFLGSRPPDDQQLLVCNSCGRGFSSKRTLNKHLRLNSSQNQGQMSCSLRRPRAPFEYHMKSFLCRICGSSFYTQGILVRHAEIHCKEPENRCGACGDHLDSTESLRDHLRTHKEVGCTCDVCGKKCGSIKRMEIHKRVHTGEKPYRCSFCSRDFSRKESLDRHLKIHSGDRPHRCHLCRKTFTRREYLVQHLKTLHCERLGPPVGLQEIQHVSVTL